MVEKIKMGNDNQYMREWEAEQDAKELRKLKEDILILKSNPSANYVLSLEEENKRLKLIEKENHELKAKIALWEKENHNLKVQIRELEYMYDKNTK